MRWAATAIVALTVVSAASRMWLLPVHFSVDPNEGWNGFQAARAMGAGPLYPPPGGLIGNNYPPLSFFLVGWLGRILGDAIVAGRLLALVSMIGVGAIVGAIGASLGGRGSAASVVGALLFFALNATILRRYVALDDPQWFAHALMMAAIFVLLPRQADSGLTVPRAICAAALVTLGALVKHNLAAWPIAATLWLALHHRRALVPWIGTLVVLAGFAGVALYLTYGANFFADVLNAPRAYSLVRMVDRAAVPMLVMGAMIGLAAPLLRARRSDSRIDLILLAILVAVPVGVFQRSGEGVDFNAHFEAMIALSIGCGVALGRHQKESRSERAGFGALALLLVVLLGTGIAAEAREVKHYRFNRASWRVMEQQIRATRGGVACEATAMCFWAGQPFLLDFFLYGQQAARSGDLSALATAFDDRRIVAIELEPARATLTGQRGGVLVEHIERRSAPAYIDSQGRRFMAIKGSDVRSH